MSRIISRSESWETAYTALANINFSAFDYDTVKQSLIDYVKLYFPETFSDYIESSEFVAILELFAYVAELMAYRFDITAHENFISIAERKESVLRLAKLISYKATRNIPARGLVKITSISTTEQIFDSQGRNLFNRRIIWNDFNNLDWKEQFFLIMNRVLDQPFGSVSPTERVQVQDVLFELYRWNNNALTNGVFSYKTNITGKSVSMELVPVVLTKNGPQERRPENNTKFSLLYGNDGLGDASDVTGFFMYTKQGTLQSLKVTFDGVTPNQIYELELNNINDTDIWVNNISPAAGQIIDDGTGVGGLRSGEWEEVDIASAQNIIFNTNINRRKYEVETLNDDRVRLIFGDGEFADIPSGMFEIWFRTSINQDIVIPQNTIANQIASFTYQDVNNNVQTVTFTFSAISTFQNSSASESIEHIRSIAPSVYYTQERMVNARDYNSFMLQDPSILKLRAINRTFAGDSKYIPWHDPRESYENVKIFGDDLLLYYQTLDSPETGFIYHINSPVTATELVNNYIEPILSSTDFFVVLTSKGVSVENIRRRFKRDNSSTHKLSSVCSPWSTECEIYSFSDAISEPLLTEYDDILERASIPLPTEFDIYYSIVYDEWTVGPHYYDSSSPDAQSFWMMTIIPNFSTGGNLIGWSIVRNSQRLIAHSEATRFWNTNNSNVVVDYDTLDLNRDTIVVLKANPDSTRKVLLSSNKIFDILGQELIGAGTGTSLPDGGLSDIHRLNVLPEDINGDGIADNLELTDLFNNVISVNTSGLGSPTNANSITITFSDYTSEEEQHRFLYGLPDQNAEIEVYRISGGVTTKLSRGGSTGYRYNENQVSGTVFANGITVLGGPPALGTIRVVIKDYVYLSRDSIDEKFTPIKTTNTVKLAWVIDQNAPLNQRLYQRWPGRRDLNFAWFHYTPQFNLIDPSTTNIIDIYVITRAYYTSLLRWLNRTTTIQPKEPTSLDLRTSYVDLIDNKMISDTVIMHSGKFKILFGSYANPELQAIIKVIRTEEGTLTDNEVKVRVVETIQLFFDITKWEFGETFYFTELASSIHRSIPTEVASVVLVPTFSRNQFGDLYEITAREDEIFQPDITVSNIEIIESLTPLNIRQDVVS